MVDKIKLVVITVLLTALFGCLVPGPYTSEGQRESMRRFVESNKSENWILIKQDKWEYDKVGHRYLWQRHQDWYNPEISMITSTGAVLDSTDKSYDVVLDPHRELIYLGKWHYVPKIGKKIRLMALQATVGGGIRAQFESLDDKNKNIPAMPLTLKNDIKRGGFSLDAEELARIKWHDKYGYNAVYDLETDRIVQAEE